MKDGETDGGLQAVRQLFLHLSSTVILHSCCMLRSCSERKGKGSPTEGVHLPQKAVVFFLFFFFFWIFWVSVKWLHSDVSLVPPSWERGQDCSLHWYWPGTRWTWGSPGTCSSGWTPTIHTGPSWRECSPLLQGRCERGSVNRQAWVCLLTAWCARSCVQPFTANVTCAPGPSVLFPLRPLGVRVKANLHRQQLCAGETPPEGEQKSAKCDSGSQGKLRKMKLPTTTGFAAELSFSTVSYLQHYLCVCFLCEAQNGVNVNKYRNTWRFNNLKNTVGNSLSWAAVVH